MHGQWVLADATVSWPEVGAVVGTAAAIGLVLWWGGAFTAGALGRSPRRELDLGLVDLLLGGIVLAMVVSDKLVVDLLATRLGWLTISAEVESGLRSLATLGLLAGAALLVGKAFLSEAGLRRAGLVPRRPGRDLVYGALGLVVGVVWTFTTLLVTNVVATWAGQPSPPVNHGVLTQMQQLMAEGNWAVIGGLVVMAVVVGPVLEELFFRGMLQTWLLQAVGRGSGGRWTAVLVASAVFSVVHLGATSWHALPGLLVLGAVLGWLYERTGSLWPSVIVHAGFNAVNVGMVLGGIE